MRKTAITLCLLLVAAMALTTFGCGGDGEDTTPTPTKTGAVTATPEPTGFGYTGGKHTFKLSHTSLPGHPMYALWEMVDEKLRYYTDGQVKCEIFPGGSLYGSFDVWYALATGACDIGNLAEYVLQAAGFIDYQIGYLNFFWGDTDDVNVVWAHDRRFWEHPDGGQTMFKQTDKAGVKMLAFFPSGVYQVVINKFGMTSMYDMKNRKISTVGGLTGLFAEATDATQVMIAPEEFNIAFQQGLVDVSASSPESCLTQRLYDIGKYGFVVSALISHSFWGMNLNLWNSLSPELQDVIQNKVIPDIMDWVFEARPEGEMQALGELEDKGVKLVWQENAERIELRDRSWDIAWEKGYLKGMNEDLLKLADHLRSEPYDQGYFYP